MTVDDILYAPLNSVTRNAWHETVKQWEPVVLFSGIDCGKTESQTVIGIGVVMDPIDRVLQEWRDLIQYQYWTLATWANQET